jgi:hypothetical protein
MDLSLDEAGLCISQSVWRSSETLSVRAHWS